MRFSHGRFLFPAPHFSNTDTRDSGMNHDKASKKLRCEVTGHQLEKDALDIINMRHSTQYSSLKEIDLDKILNMPPKHTLG